MNYVFNAHDFYHMLADRDDGHYNDNLSMIFDIVGFMKEEEYVILLDASKQYEDYATDEIYETYYMESSPYRLVSILEYNNETTEFIQNNVVAVPKTPFRASEVIHKKNGKYYSKFEDSDHVFPAFLYSDCKDIEILNHDETFVHFRKITSYPKPALRDC